MPKFTIGQRVALRLAAADALGVGLDVQILDPAAYKRDKNVYQIKTLNGEDFFPWLEAYSCSSVWIPEIDLTNI